MGKTYISILLIKEIYGEPLNSNRNNIIQYEKKTNKKVLCLFKTVSLLLQQSKVIKHNTLLKILKLYGNSENLILSSHEKFNKILKKNDIICGTPESIYRYFTFGYLKIEDFELVVVDECHHCKENDFYNRIFKHFILFNQNIKILGLTASPCEKGVLEESKLKNQIQELCNNMNCFLTCPKNLLNNEKDDNKE